MTTVINNPSDNSSATGVIVGIVVVIVLGALFFMYALPLIRGQQVKDDQGSLNINVQLPTGESNTGNKAEAEY